MNANVTADAAVTINPTTGDEIARYPYADGTAIERLLESAERGVGMWRGFPVLERASLLAQAARLLRERVDELAALATHEMGKPLAQARAELLKCATGCDYYAEHGPTELADVPLPIAEDRVYVAYRPLGVLLAIMPWNFPYWQAFRAAAPALLAGNAVVLKHAENVTGCALAIERIFADAGVPAGVFSVLVTRTDDLAGVVADPRIAAVTLTGSERAGSAVASNAGRALKKTVLELGGSDAFVVLADADVDGAARVAVTARFQNNGQSCIAAKRFICEASVYDAFREAFVAGARALVLGDPAAPGTTLGPLARADLRESLADQVRRTIAGGGRLLAGGAAPDRAGFFYEATVVEDVTPALAMGVEETFGPAAALMRARDPDHAIELANATPYGLGGNLWTADLERAATLAARFESGAVFVNGMTASDPRAPFGGIKRSGHGRELGTYGLHEFVNVQTVWFH